MLFAGIDIGGTSVKMGVLDANTGKIIYTDRADTGKISPVEMANAILKLYNTAKESVGEISGAGVVCAGRVQPKTGLVNAGNLDWWDVPFGVLLKERLGENIILDNDVQGALYGEWRTGVCKGLENVVYVTLGTGIGGALLINGQTYRGVNHEGAELGHIVTHADGEKCTCGGRGCWEVYASATALSRMAGGMEPRQVFDSAAAGNPRTKCILQRYIHELCIGVSSLNSLFRPEMIVIGGGLSEAGEQLFGPLMQELREDAPSIPIGAVPHVEKASLGNQAGLLGAALMARDAFSA